MVYRQCVRKMLRYQSYVHYTRSVMHKDTTHQHHNQVVNHSHITHPGSTQSLSVDWLSHCRTYCCIESGSVSTHSNGLTCVDLTFSGCAPESCGVAVPEATFGVPIPEKGLTAPLGGTGILMSSGLPGTMLSGRLGILMRFATLL